MWKIKTFKTIEQVNAFIEKNKNKYQCDLRFIENGYLVEYRLLKKL